MKKRVMLISAIVGLVVMGGAVFGWMWYSGNQSAFRGRAIPVKGLPEAMVKSWRDAFKDALNNDEVLEEIIAKSDYASSLEISGGEALENLRKAAVVRLKNSNDTIEIGLIGKRKQDDALKTISRILYERAEKEVIHTTPSFQDYLDAVSEKK
ncbi:MAG: hypothetical protein ACPGJR_08515 [Akkermansiaceae bacterium]